MRIVHPTVARKGAFIDSFKSERAARIAGERCERILHNTESRRELVLTYVLGKPGRGASWQLFLLP